MKHKKHFTEPTNVSQIRAFMSSKDNNNNIRMVGLMRQVNSRSKFSPNSLRNFQLALNRAASNVKYFWSFFSLRVHFNIDTSGEIYL